MNIKIKRFYSGDKQTNGILSIENDGDLIFECYTLELPWKDNQHNISCIPKGEYEVEFRYSQKHGNHLHILNVKDRSYILIHSNNYVLTLRGCVGVGDKLFDLNNDGLVDTTNSKKTLKKIMSFVEKDKIYKLKIN